MRPHFPPEKLRKAALATRQQGATSGKPNALSWAVAPLAPKAYKAATSRRYPELPKRVRDTESHSSNSRLFVAASCAV